MVLHNFTKLVHYLSAACGNLESNKSKTSHPIYHPQFIEVDKYLTSQYLLKLIKIVGYHPYPLDELSLMASAVQYHMPDIIIDIGTHQGKSARIWFELTQHFGIQTSIHTIDIFDPNHPEFPGHALGKFIRDIPVEQHIGEGYEISCDLIKNYF